jgi:hypothetical protein
MSRTLSKREQILAAVVGAIVIFGGSFILGSSYLSKRAALESKIAGQKKQLRSMNEMLGQRAFWEKREQWVQAKQPKMENSDTAGVQLLDYVQQLAKKHSVVLEKLDIHAAERRPECVAVALDLETKSPWGPLVTFLSELQSPEQFIAVETVNIKVDASDLTQMRGHLKIARWYAPN